MRFSQLRVLVNDMATSYHFYHDILQLTSSFGGPEDVYADFFLGEESGALALFDRKLMADSLGDATSGAEVAGDRSLLGLGVDDVDATTAAIIERGGVCVAPPTDRPDWGLRTAHFRDPDGYLIEIHQRIAMA